MPQSDQNETSRETKVRIRIGQIEVDYEGRHDFLTSGLEGLLGKLVELSKQAPEALKIDENGDSAVSKKKPNSSGKIGSVGDVAAKLKVSSGSELALAAAAKMTLGDGLETFTRDQLTAAMKSATAYYKATYTSNLTNSLKTLLKAQQLSESGDNVYAVPAGEREKLSGLLAN